MGSEAIPTKQLPYKTHFYLGLFDWTSHRSLLSLSRFHGLRWWHYASVWAFGFLKSEFCRFSFEIVDDSTENPWFQSYYLDLIHFKLSHDTDILSMKLFELIYSHSIPISTTIPWKTCIIHEAEISVWSVDSMNLYFVRYLNSISQLSHMYLLEV